MSENVWGLVAPWPIAGYGTARLSVIMPETDWFINIELDSNNNVMRNLIIIKTNIL